MVESCYRASVLLFTIIFNVTMPVLKYHDKHWMNIEF